ncbi:Fc receptor, IgE, high affinity I, gamma polypeptide like [Chanos chanos]|uniref:Fc receptor, IgE, high affinity I, gamma polypeptide like n=1 Tax=Chanos chanos TaxID=29144 RepID=A0AC50VK51_CHACN|nr:high affinity immunoglobulin epsilon receptor subunit gamma-like [Chanos chanos]
MKGSVVFLVLFLNFGSAAATDDGKLCYILDAILVIYGVVLTVLYCRLRMRPQSGKEQQEKAEGIYQGLSPRPNETYETLQVKSKGAAV